MNDIEKIKTRIQKLLRMAADTSSPEEAAIAADRASRLMRKHQLDHADVIVEELQSDASLDAVKWGKGYIAQPIWMQSLAVSIARATETGVKYVSEFDEQRRRRVKILQFCGYKPDVELATWLMSYLCDQIKFMAIAHRKLCESSGTEWEFINSPRSYMVSYRQGLSSAIRGKLAQFYKNNQADVANTATALVVAKENAIRAKFGDFRYRSGGRGARSMGGYAHGHRDGKNINVSRAVGGKTTHKPKLLN